MKQVVWIVLPLQFLIILGCKDQAGNMESADDALVDPFIEPVVVFTTPANHSEGPYASPPLSQPDIVIKFNKIMDRNSLARAIRISQPANQVVLDTNKFDMLKGELLLFYRFAFRNQSGTPFEPKVGVTYVLTISTLAKDISGNHLREDFNLSFRPEPQFRVTYIIYPDSTDLVQNTAAHASWDISFNGPVGQDMFHLITIDSGPQAVWHYSYDGVANAIHTNLDNLQFDQSYTLHIPASVHDIYGNYLKTGMTRSFKTPRFKPVLVYPPDGSRDVRVTQGIDFYFTGNLDSTSIYSSFDLTPAVAGTVLHSGVRIGFQPSEELFNSQSYTATVSGSLRSLDGTSLDDAVVTRFVTESFRVHDCEAGINLATRNTDIVVDLTANYDTSTVSPAFAIFPPVAGVFDFATSSVPRHTFIFMANSPLDPKITYTVTISNALVSKNGIHIEPFTTSFPGRD